MGYYWSIDADGLTLVGDDDARRVRGWRPGAPDLIVVDRAYTAEESTAADARSTARAEAATITTNEADLIARAKTALTANAAFLAATNPTTAQAVAQVKALTRQVNALIRLVGRDLLSTDGT